MYDVVHCGMLLQYPCECTHEQLYKASMYEQYIDSQHVQELHDCTSFIAYVIVHLIGGTLYLQSKLSLPHTRLVTGVSHPTASARSESVQILPYSSNHTYMSIQNLSWARCMCLE